jgi:hypothetical protein
MHGGRIRGAVVQAADDAELIPIRLERAVDVFEGKAFARRVGREPAHHHAVRYVDESEARLGGDRRGEGRHHRVQERQRHGGA